MIHFLLIAQGTADSMSPLYTYGPLGIFCAWLMWRGERVYDGLNKLSHRIDGLTRAMLVDVLSRDTGPTTHKTAQEMLSKIEARDSDK